MPAMAVAKPRSTGVPGQAGRSRRTYSEHPAASEWVSRIHKQAQIGRISSRCKVPSLHVSRAE